MPHPTTAPRLSDLSPQFSVLAIMFTDTTDEGRRLEGENGIR